MVAGPSRSGKTFLGKFVLENCVHVLNKFVENIVWVYTYFQPFDVRETDSHLQKTQMFNELNPFIFLLKFSIQSHLTVLDDVSFQASNHPDMVRIFTQYRYYKNIIGTHTYRLLTIFTPFAV